MFMQIDFPGGECVEARFKNHAVRTDQPAASGGSGTGPAPYDLFLASLGTCAGYYALRFCRQRKFDTSGLGLSLEPVRDPDSRRLTTVRIEISLPAGFPEKYRRAIVRAAHQCAVTKTLFDPPEVEIEIV